MQRVWRALFFIVILVAGFILTSQASWAAQPDSLQVYVFSANTTTLQEKEEGYGQFDWTRLGFKAYRGKFMLRIEQDLYSNSMKYSYLEYSDYYADWKFGIKGGKHLVPMMGNFPPPVFRPMPRWAYAIKDLPVYGTGLCAYVGRGDLKLHFGNFGYEAYQAKVDLGPVTAFWIKNYGQGLFFKESFHPWVNLHMGWTNYEDRIDRDFPDRRNTAFVENHIRLGDRVRIFAHQDIGDHRGAFIGGLNYALFPNDKGNTFGIFYDTNNKWQLRLNFSFSQVIYPGS